MWHHRPLLVGIGLLLSSAAVGQTAKPGGAQASGNKPASAAKRSGSAAKMLPTTKRETAPQKPVGRGNAPAAPAQRPAETAVTVVVRASSEVAKPEFTLADLAEISGSDRELVAQISAISFGASPLPGLSRGLFPGEVTVRLRSAHLDIPRVKVTLPPTLRVTRAANNVAADEVTKAAVAAAQAAFKDRDDLRLEPAQALQNLTLPSGKLVLITGPLRGQPEQGSVLVPVTLMVDGAAAQTVEVALRVHRKARVLVAQRTIEPNELLSKRDVRLAAIELPPGFTQPLLKVREAVGKRAKRRLLAETPISATALELPPAIMTNARITLEVVSGGIHITTTGVARQSGAVGDTIRVYAADTKKELDGVILDSRTVRIGDPDDEKTATDTEKESEDEDEDDPR